MEDETQEPREIDATLVMGEAVLGAISALLTLVPIQDPQGDITKLKAIQQLQGSMGTLAQLLVLMGSDKVAMKPEAEVNKPSSSIILPS